MRTRLALAGLLLAVVAGSAAAGTAGPHLVVVDAAGRRILEELNRIRVTHGLRPLQSSRLLVAAARGHCRDMAVKGYFGHERPQRRGPTFAARLAAYYPARPGRMWGAGENVLWVPRMPTPKAAVAAFMASPEHRANILDSRWREVGVAVVRATHAAGPYRGRNVTLVTTDFGLR